jgi:hypothetical protein
MVELECGENMIDWKRELNILSSLKMNTTDQLREAAIIFDKAGMKEVADFLIGLGGYEREAEADAQDERNDELIGLRSLTQEVIREIRPLYPLLSAGDLTQALEKLDDDLAGQDPNRDPEDQLRPVKSPPSRNPKKLKKGQKPLPPVDLSYNYDEAASLFDSEQLTYLFRHDIREGVIRLECAQFTAEDHLALMREEDVRNLVVAALASDAWHDEVLEGVQEGFAAAAENKA